MITYLLAKQAVIYRRSWPQVKKLAAAAVVVANGDIIGHYRELSSLCTLYYHLFEH